MAYPKAGVWALVTVVAITVLSLGTTQHGSVVKAYHPLQVREKANREKAIRSANSEKPQRRLEGDLHEPTTVQPGNTNTTTVALSPFPTWGVGSILAAIALFTTYLLCLSFCVRTIVVWNVGFDGRPGLREDWEVFLSMYRHTYGLLPSVDDAEEGGSDRVVQSAVRMEMRFMALYPLIPLIAAGQTTCEDGPPTWLYFVYLPLLVRSKVVEVSLLRRLGVDVRQREHRGLIVGLCMGCLDHFDYFTDGLFPLQAYTCEPDITEAFTHTFAESALPWGGPAVALMHFWGLSIAVLAFAVLAQQAAGMDDSEPGAIAAADVPGFGGLSEHFDSRAGDLAGIGPLLVTFTKVLVENCIQLWLQTTYLGLVWDRVSAEGRLKQMASVAFGIAGGAFKCSKAIWALLTRFRDDPGDRWLCGACILVFPASLSLLILSVLCAKLWHTLRCPAHMWNLTTQECIS